MEYSIQCTPTMKVSMTSPWYELISTERSKNSSLLFHSTITRFKAYFKFNRAFLKLLFETIPVGCEVKLPTNWTTVLAVIHYKSYLDPGYWKVAC